MSTLLFLNPIPLKNEIIGHTSLEIQMEDKKSYVFIIGGYSFESSSQKINFQYFSIKDEKVFDMEQYSEVPKSRFFHSSIYLFDNIYIIGGINIALKSVSKFCYVYNISK